MRSQWGRSITDRVVESLGQSIVGGDLAIARVLRTDAALGQHFCASRSVTREAVKILSTKGLLITHSRQGTYVQPEEAWNLYDPDVLRWLLDRKFSLTLLRHVTEVRLAIEPAAAALAARRAAGDSLAAILASLERMYAAERGQDELLAADIAFHVSILKASGNLFYIQLDELVNTALRISIRFTSSRKDRNHACVAAHRKVADAIVARDPGAASAAMTEVLTEVLDLIARAQAEPSGGRGGVAMAAMVTTAR